MLDLTGNAWRREAWRLARWAQERLVNRTDVYGAYLPLGSRQPGKSNNYTAPAKDLRQPGVLTAAIIEEHFRGYDQGSLIGVHTISPACTCKWFVIDIDQHGDDQAALAEANAKAAFAWHTDLQQRGFHPLLLDSNGHGGYHLLVVLSEPVASQRVHAFAGQFVQDFATRGLAQAPEVGKKRCQEPLLRFLGRSWGRSMLSSPNRHAIWSDQKPSPQGQPRFTARRSRQLRLGMRQVHLLHAAGHMPATASWFARQLPPEPIRRPHNPPASRRLPCAHWRG
jgi:hypothetical protein